MSQLPDLQQDAQRPLHIYAGHLSSDPEAASLPPTTVTAHIFFVLLKNRRVADKERILFWFNVSLSYVFLIQNLDLIEYALAGRSRLFFFRRVDDGDGAIPTGWEGRLDNHTGWMGGIYDYGFQ